jgi:RNA polymerase sigma-70 factor (ECF subfamily)
MERDRRPSAVASAAGDLAALIGRMAGGDEAALAALYDATSAVVHGLALRILRDPAAAEDVVLEVYLQAHRQAASYDPERGTPWAWLLVMARSRALDRLRAEGAWRRRHEPLRETDAHVESGPGPDEQSQAADQARRVRAAVATLPPTERQVLEVAYFGGLSHTEIAAHLDLPLGTVKTRVRSAMARLRDLLTPLVTGDQA